MVLKLVKVEACQSILDIGCGNLEVVEKLNLANYTEVDVSPQAIALVKFPKQIW